MQARTTFPFHQLAVFLGLALALGDAEAIRAGSYRGLWVGQITLNRVNGVSVPLDANNNPKPEKPEVATPTADAANLRLILHVNGAGQVSLLKDVAVLNRVSGGTASNIVNLVQNGSALDAQGNVLRAESDYALVTDERLYPDYPVQAAIRFASAVFDFGDALATEAVNAVLDAAATNAAQSVFDSTANFNNSAQRQSAQTAAQNAALDPNNMGNAQLVVDHADVAVEFDRFLREELKKSVVTQLATGDPQANVSDLVSAAEAVRDRSYYGDTRALELVTAITNLAAQASLSDAEKVRDAQNLASSYADASDDYQRFLAGKLFGDMILSAAGEAASAAVVAGANAGTIAAAVHANSDVQAAGAEALRLKNPMYEDSRTTNAVNQVLNAIIASAAGSAPAAPSARDDVEAAALLAGRDALEKSVERFPVHPRVPTLDYNDFVRSTMFLESAGQAAAAAAEGAVSERVNNALYTAQSVRDAAKVAAFEALLNVYSTAARAVRSDLPLTGRFGPGEGDPRLSWEIDRNGESPLGPAALTGTIYLPASHPTNPFRHRRHPDNTVGFDITRNLRFDFNAADGNVLPRAGYGVDRVTGVFREEIFGLHKPLGQHPDTDPIGLRVEGTFELNRVSLIDTLNAR
jgi:hypothetical protein